MDNRYLKMENNNASTLEVSCDRVAIMRNSSQNLKNDWKLVIK